jgi:ribosomal protein S18 acetylase RimI-like enzyme
MSVTIETVAPGEAAVDALSALLIEVVANDGSVGFLHPLDRSVADAYWRGALDDSGRIVLGAWRAGRIVGTVTVFLDSPDNQRHRAEIWKMMVAPAARRLGVAEALLRAAEARAAQEGRTLLNLDTVEKGPASRLYERLGWRRVGEIPNYALTPRGEWTATTIYFKALGGGAQDAPDG